MFDPRCRPYRKNLVVMENKIHTVTTHEGKPIWTLMKEFINKLDNGSTFTVTDMINHIYTHEIYCIGTPATYKNRLVVIGILECCSDGIYKKLRDIPDELTTPLLAKLSNQKTWESWFYQLDHLPK